MDMKYIDQSADDHSEVDHSDNDHSEKAHLDKDDMDNDMETSVMIPKTPKSTGADQSHNEEKLLSTHTETARNIGKPAIERQTGDKDNLSKKGGTSDNDSKKGGNSENLYRKGGTKSPQGNKDRGSDRQRTQAIKAPRCTRPIKLFIQYLCCLGLLLAVFGSVMAWILKRKSLLSNTIISMTILHL